MAKTVYIGLSNKSRHVDKMYISLNGKSRTIKKGYIGVSGKSKIFFEIFIWDKYNAVWVSGARYYRWTRYNSVQRIMYQWNKYKTNQTLERTSRDFTYDNPSTYFFINRGSTPLPMYFVRSSRGYTIDDLILDSNNMITGINDSPYTTISPNDELEFDGVNDMRNMSFYTIADYTYDYNGAEDYREMTVDLMPSAPSAYILEITEGSNGCTFITYGIESGTDKGDFIEVVESNSSSTYPKDGAQNGFYYEYIGTTTTYVQGSTNYGEVTSYNRSAYPDNGRRAADGYWYVYKGTGTEEGSYQQGSTNYGEVTSSNKNAYPENGRHTDGYWYVKQSE